MTTFLDCFSVLSSCSYGPLLQEMTLEEKVGQLLMVHFHGEDANDDAEILIRDAHVGGIIYYTWANGLSSPRKVCRLSHNLQSLASKTAKKISLFIAADQEGGLVSRLVNGFTVFPGNKALGMTESFELAKSCAQAMGEEARRVGVNWILGPVLDVNKKRNPVIGIRSFGEDAAIASQCAIHALSGYREAKILTCVKHFPGHGDVLADSHKDLPVVQKARDDLDAQDLLPFFAARAQADAIMTGHLLVPAIDPFHCATFSKKVIAVIRNEMGFDGVVITDSLVMDGLLKQCASVDEAALKAFQAGCDIVLLGGKTLLEGQNISLELTVNDIQRIHAHLVRAVREERLSIERIDQSVKRVLALKERIQFGISPQNIGESVSTKEHVALACRVAEKALRCRGEKLLSLRSQSCCLLAPEILKDSLSQTDFSLSCKTISFFSSLNPSTESQGSMLELAKKTEITIFCTHNAWKNPAQESLLLSILNLGKKVIVIATRDPLDVDLFPKASYLITTYSPTTPSLQAAAAHLFA